MPILPILILLLTIAFAVLWVAGEAVNKPWLRRIAGPLLVIVVAGIAAVASGISMSFESSFRYCGAIKEFVTDCFLRDKILSAFDDTKPLMKFFCDALQQPY